MFASLAASGHVSRRPWLCTKNNFIVNAIDIWKVQNWWLSKQSRSNCFHNVKIIWLLLAAFSTDARTKQEMYAFREIIWIAIDCFHLMSKL